MLADRLGRTLGGAALVCAAVASGCGQVLGLDDLVADLDEAASAAASSASATGASSGSGCSGVCGTPGCGGCPGVLVVTFRSSAGELGIAQYAVTLDDYRAFLAANPTTANQRPE